MERNTPQVILGYTFLYAVLLWVLFPYLVMATSALKPRPEIFAIPPQFWPQAWCWQNFAEIWQAVPLARFLANSLWVSSASTLLALAFGIPAGYVLARVRFPGARLYMVLVLITQMFSPIIIILGLYKLMATYKLLACSASWASLTLNGTT